MSSPTLIQTLGAILFAVAVLHTFSTRFFERLAHAQPRHAGIWHLLGEVEQLASHVGVLDAGRLRFQGTLAALRERARPALVLRCDDPSRAIRVLVEAGEDPSLAEGHALRLWPRLPVPELNRRLVAAGVAVSHLALEPVTLERLFFDLTTPADRQEQVA